MTQARTLEPVRHSEASHSGEPLFLCPFAASAARLPLPQKDEHHD